MGADGFGHGAGARQGQPVPRRRRSRDDGYHELTTVFHAVSLFDEITVRNADVLSWRCPVRAATLPTDDRNLAWRAAELMAEHVGRAPDVAITIEKSIPVAGGMAGGSADAAAVLVAMNALWESACRAVTCTRWPPAGQRRAVRAARRHGAGHRPRRAAGDRAGPQHVSLGTRVRRRRPVDPAVFAEIDRLREADDRSAPAAAGSRAAAGGAGLRRPGALAPLLGQRPAARRVEPATRICAGRCAPASTRARWPGSCPARGRRARSCARRRRRRSTSAWSWPAPGSAARSGWPAARCTAHASCRRRPRGDGIGRPRRCDTASLRLVWQLLKSSLR